MRENNISDKDLLEEARLNGQVDSAEKTKTAILERNAEVSVVAKKEC